MVWTWPAIIVFLLNAFFAYGIAPRLNSNSSKMMISTAIPSYQVRTRNSSSLSFSGIVMCDHQFNDSRPLKFATTRLSLPCQACTRGCLAKFSFSMSSLRCQVTMYYAVSCRYTLGLDHKILDPPQQGPKLLSTSKYEQLVRCFRCSPSIMGNHGVVATGSTRKKSEVSVTLH
ncbi:hypothetical protein F5I97DRAFT_1299775 [Phlebopus sp. FC_14]|nr:hypothetical protein F5I97DRAFT_1299775 [Phlebopus sp. FC_14]